MSLFSGLLSEMMLLALNCWSIIDSWLSIDIDLYLPTMKVATNVELCWRDVPIQLAFLPVATFLAPVKKKSLQRTASVVVHLPADLDLILIRLYNLHSRRGRWNWIQKRGKGREMTIWYTKFLERERDFYLERRVDRKWNWRRIHCWRSRNNCRHRSSSTAEWTANCRSRSGTWPSRYSWDSWSSRASSTSPRPRSMSCRAKWRPSSMAASPGARTSKCPEILLLFFFFFLKYLIWNHSTLTDCSKQWMSEQLPPSKRQSIVIFLRLRFWQFTISFVTTISWFELIWILFPIDFYSAVGEWCK